MSHFTIIKTQLRDRDLLCQALQKMGFDTVELHDTPQPLYGYEGDMRPERAEVIVRRQFIGELSNDIGFQKQKDGSYSAIISDFDRWQYDQQWLGKLGQCYGYLALLKSAQEQGLTVDVAETLADGTIRLVLAG
jgi:Protein of unknown function (DUF1257).